MSDSGQNAPSTNALAKETGLLLTDGCEVLLRQIHPDLYLGGKVASTAFAPTSDDNGELSVDRSSLTTPGESFALYAANGRKSVAVYGVSVQQFEAQGIPCRSDPLPETDKLKANKAHAYADFRGIDTLKKQKQAAQRIKDLAIGRGRLYPP